MTTTNTNFTYGGMGRRVDAMASFLTSLGIGRGDRVAALAHNGVEFFDIQSPAPAPVPSVCSSTGG